jgi:acetyl-CoA carboxylase carboxyltransferase component
MDPNVQAQYVARDLGEACRILLRHYDHTWVAPGERFPRPAATADPRDRDVRPGLAEPFDIRGVMTAVADQDQPSLERWYGMRDAETAVVCDAHLGGHPVCLLGFESKPGMEPDLAAKKMARAIHAASGNRPLVILAAGSDGPHWPLEHGAEIARAMVDFKGPIVFCSVSGNPEASVVFSKALHDNMEVVVPKGLERLRPELIEAVERGMEKA